MDEKLPPIDLWDKYVPIISVDAGDGSFHTTVHIVDAIGEPRLYTELLSLLENAKEEDTIMFNLNTPGGRLDTTTMLIDALDTTLATTIGKITGEVASAGTMIAMAMDDLQTTPFGSMMIHNYSSGLFGKGNELKSRMDFETPHLAFIFHSVYKNFLSKKERLKVISGDDKYMAATEIDLRWAKVQGKRQKAFDKMNVEAEKANTEALLDHLANQGYTITKEVDS